MRTACKLRLPALALLAAMAGLVPAARAQDDSEVDEEAELLDLLAEETGLATRTMQNSDYVPGIVSVLHGDELEALGMRTVLDALALVPGIEANRDQNGNATLRVRGIDFFFNSGNVKVLVDSLDMGAESSAINSGVLLLPLAQVQRIEVIRGPGSSLHGDYAFTGLVNIITRQDQGRVVLQAGEGRWRSAVAAGSGQAGSWELGGNVSSTRSDRFDAPGDQPADERRDHANAHARIAGFSARLAALDRSQVRPPALPPPGTPPPPPGSPPPRPQRRAETLLSYELRHDWQFGAERQLGLGYTRQDADSGEGPNRFEGGYDQFGFDGAWRAAAHLLVFEGTYARHRIDRAVLQPATGAAPSQGIAPFSDQRDAWSLTVQDQVDLGPALTLTGGLRYDRLAGVDDRLTPRLALVWRIDEQHALKAQYAQGFRTPTFVELFSTGQVNPELDFEAIATAELGYLYRAGEATFRATVFQSEVDNLILRRAAPQVGHANLSRVEARGIEFEWTQPFGERLKLVSTLAFVDTEDERGNRQGRPGDSFGSPDVLGNLALLYRPAPAWTLGAHWNHVGDRAIPGTRASAGYDRVDLAATCQFDGGLRLQLALRNVLDQPITYIAQVPPGRTQVADFGAQSWSVQLAWDW